MRTSFLFYSAPLFALIVTACSPTPPIAVSATNNEDINVETLFVHDGCTMYRFRDYFSYHYYARCQAGSAPPTAQTMSVIRCGKNCVRPDDIATTEENPSSSSP